MHVVAPLSVGSYKKGELVTLTKICTVKYLILYTFHKEKQIYKATFFNLYGMVPFGDELNHFMRLKNSTLICGHIKYRQLFRYLSEQN